MTILTPNDNEFRVTKIIKENEELIKKINAENEAKNNNDNSDDDNDDKNEIEVDIANNINKPYIDEAKRTEQFVAFAQKIKTKQICVLGIGKRWWDCEIDVDNQITKYLGGNRGISHVILEYAGLSWAVLKFDYPITKTKAKDKDGMLALQGAMNEVFESGIINNKCVLLLSKMARDPKTGILNNWVFKVCHVPNNFVEMW
eukprot:CAMPEP_0114684796 /NCGR_PEP_ID=MMETSP0191-20121206/59589_1 /TAXON_ID=126664 /ORGANISM="Sorites sp." /LENGTH=200 /DNA_ID=CAMNT_0001968143 /DNA_START=409 /DNA_END=1008 /DNA_ORIENTATION=-